MKKKNKRRRARRVGDKCGGGGARGEKEGVEGSASSKSDDVGLKARDRTAPPPRDGVSVRRLLSGGARARVI